MIPMPDTDFFSHSTALILIGIMLTLMAANAASAGVVTSDTIREEVERFVKSRYERGDLEIEVSVPRAVDITVDEDVRPVIVVSQDTERQPGRSLPVIVSVTGNDGEVVRKLRLITRLKYFIPAVTIKRDVVLGGAITPDDVVVAKVEVTGIKDYYTDPAKLGKIQANKRMNAGTVLTRFNTRSISVVRRGDTVDVEIQSGGVCARTSGTVRENGGTGDHIKVYINMTRVTIMATVVDSQTVRAGVEGG